MLARAWVPVSGMLGLVLLAVPLAGPMGVWRPKPAVASAADERQPPASTRRCEALLREACIGRTRARLIVNQEREALDRWDPGGGERVDWERWRLQQMAADRTGALHRGWQAARQAEAAARTPDECYRSAEILVLLEHEAGDHAAEIGHARKLVTLRPQDQRARMVQERVARCRQQRPLTPQQRSIEVSR
jgi:hypothetical protein